MMSQRIAVIGAGVLGLSVARSLALQGADVTLFEKSTPGSGTSQTSFAWINANGKSPESYHKLNALAIEEHQSLHHNAASTAPWLLETGTWEWAADPRFLSAITARAKKLARLGYPVREISREDLSAQFPELQLDPRIHHGWNFPSECLIYPSLFIAWLITAFNKSGGKICSASDVIAINEQPGGVTLQLAGGECWQGDQVVVAAGRWSAELVALTGWALAMTDANRPDPVACSFLAHTNPLPVQLNSNIITPELNVRPDGGGRLMLQTLDLDHYSDPSRPVALDGMVAQEMLRRLHRLFANTRGARIEKIDVGQRSRPEDGLPAVGYLPQRSRTYLLVTHSGMTLAPLLGRLVAEEMLSGTRPELLQDFAPDRLLSPLSSQPVSGGPAYLPAAQ